MNRTVRWVVDAIGPTLTAVCAGSRTRNLDHLTDDQIAKVELAKRVLLTLMEDEAPSVAVSYFVGMNPWLSDKSLAICIREGYSEERLIGAARAVTGDGYA